MWNLLTGLVLIVVSIVKFVVLCLIPGLIAYPTRGYYWAKKENDEEGPVVVGIIYTVVTILVLFVTLMVYSKHDEGTYMLYTIAALAITNFISGTYEIGRWYNKKKAEEKQRTIASKNYKRQKEREEQEEKVKKELKSRKDIKSIKDIS